MFRSDLWHVAESAELRRVDQLRQDHLVRNGAGAQLLRQVEHGETALRPVRHGQHGSRGGRPDVGDRLGMSEGAVRVALHRALKLLAVPRAEDNRVAVVLANLLRRQQASGGAGAAELQSVPLRKILHESFTDGAQLLLLGAMVVGLVTGDAGKAVMQPFSVDLFKGMLERKYPAPPIMRALGMSVEEVELGRVVFGYTPVFEHYNPLGSVHGGIAATLLDSVMGCCIHSTLKAGNAFTTLEIKINYVRAMTDKTGPVKAEGKLINAGQRIATSEGRLVDASGRLLAHGTTTCLIFPV